MKNKIVIIILSAAAGAVVLAILVAAFLKVANLQSQLKQANGMLRMTKEKSEALAADKEKIARENEKLQADMVSYLGLNTKLQAEKERLQKSVEDAQRIIENKEAGLQRAKSRLEEVEKGLITRTSKEHEGLVKEKKALTKKIFGLDSTLKTERALYHYNLGVAYAQSKLYDDAVTEYKKSLEEKGDNADAHYNAALIYDTVFGDAQNALFHYEKYLELEPGADDKSEIEAAMERLR